MLGRTEELRPESRARGVSIYGSFPRSIRIAAIFGPACELPMWIQYFRPRATGRIEFSARLLLDSSSGHSRCAMRVVACPSFLVGLSTLNFDCLESAETK
jgi:hypothetical protein